nr:PREDICTED: reticulon-like protein B10 [Daucus carota subsp. sativus]
MFLKNPFWPLRSVWGNRGLSIARDIAIGGDLKVLLQVVSSLWLISIIGGLLDFLTLIYVGILLSLSVPVLYEKRQDQIDDKLSVANSIVQAQYWKVDEMVLSKISFPRNKEKKTQ